MRETKADLKARTEAAEAKASLTEIALHLVVTDQPVATEVTPNTEDGESWEFRLYRPHAAHGGILIETWFDGAGRRYATAHYFETYYLAASRVCRSIGGEKAHAVADALSRLGMRAQALREGLV